jgi:hypothetical protein
MPLSAPGGSWDCFDLRLSYLGSNSRRILVSVTFSILFRVSARKKETKGAKLRVGSPWKSAKPKPNPKPSKKFNQRPLGKSGGQKGTTGVDASVVHILWAAEPRPITFLCCFFLLFLSCSACGD